MALITEELPRHGLAIGKEILEDSPLLVVQGARQVGKSTLLRQLLSSEEAEFVTLDDERSLAMAKADPRGFIEQAPHKTLVIDEAQRVPQLALALKASIDADRRPNRFAISGSADLLQTPGVSDSLAGRAERLTVNTLSQGELMQRDSPEDWVSWIVNGAEGASTVHGESELIRKAVISGGYPEPLKRSAQRRIDSWFDSYISGLVTHDAKELAGPSQFALYLQHLLSLVAAQGHSELVKAKYARSLGVSETTLAQYLDLAEIMYLTDTLPSWGIGYSGRVVRRPKIQLSDTGLAANITDFTVEKSRLVGGMEYFGALVEGFVVSELRKQQTWSAQRFSLYHYRERDTEIDIVIELRDGRVILVEVKSALDVNERAWKHISSMQQRLGKDRVVAGVVFYLGSQASSLTLDHGTVHLLSIDSLWRHPDV